MKTVILLIGLLFSTFSLQAQDYEDVMSEAYWKIWNSDVQASINKNIEQYRKGDAELNIPSGVTVKIEQLSHSFIFGGNIFLFGQLETTQQNRQYENTFGALFLLLCLFIGKRWNPSKESHVIRRDLLIFSVVLLSILFLSFANRIR